MNEMRKLMESVGVGKIYEEYAIGGMAEVMDMFSKDDILGFMRDYKLIGDNVVMDDETYEWFADQYAMRDVDDMDGDGFYEFLKDFVELSDLGKVIEEDQQLNEYLVREGESIDTLLRLNVFGDMGLLEDPELFTDDPDNGSEVSPEWLEVIRDYQGEAEERYLQIKSEAKRGRKLTSPEAREAENTWYDGGDLYQSEEEAIEGLPGIYANQLNIVENILHGLVDDDYDGVDFMEANQGGKTEHSGAKKGKGAYYGRKKEAKRDSNKNRRNADKAETKQLNEFEDFGFRDPADLLSSFDEELDTLLNNYWSNAEIIGNTPEEVAAIQQKLEVLLGEFISKSIRG